MKEHGSLDRSEFMAAYSFLARVLFTVQTPIKDVDAQCAEIEAFCEFLKGVARGDNMIDFTKEELEMIRDDLDHEMNTYRMADNDFNRKLRAKTQRMIDNYCEHEWINGTYCEK